MGDGAEVYGYDWVDYNHYGANPLHKDIFVELDYVQYTDSNGVLHSMKFGDALITKIQDFFAALNVANPDGTTGFAIHIFQDTVLPQGTSCSATYRDTQAPFNPRHQAAFHYFLICEGSGLPVAQTGGTRSAIKGAAPDNDPSNDQNETQQFYFYADFVHELGHSLGMQHGGGSGTTADTTNCKPQYPSMMNYIYEYDFNGGSRTLQGTNIQYSTGVLPPLTETSLSEKNSFPGVPAADLSFITQSRQHWSTQVNSGNFWVDWRADGTFSDAPVSSFTRFGSGATNDCPATGVPYPGQIFDRNDAQFISTMLPNVIGGAGDAGDPDADIERAMATTTTDAERQRLLQKVLARQSTRSPARAAADAASRLSAKYAAIGAKPIVCDLPPVIP